MNSFSAKNRVAIIEQMCHSQFDLLIIGGGITGAGIALDATARGLKVALIEMQDFAAGTSGRSTKLIHGGLRYLKQREFKLVAEVGKEREIIHRNAPHLTIPEKMLLPIVEKGSLGRFTSRIGMMLYEWLAGVKKSERHKVLNKEETILTEPLLQKDKLLGSVLFYEYRTDDARLTIEVMKEAVERGAVIVNYTRAVGFIYENSDLKKKIIGCKVRDEFTQAEHEIKANYVVNASGPWVDELDDLDGDKKLHKLQITKGVHIVVDREKIPVNQAVYFDTPDNRMIFVIPRDRKIYVGTTDSFYNGDLQNPQVNESDKNYLISSVNQFFPDNKISLTDIESCWAGLRPLINKPGKGPSEISRKDEMFLYDSGLITIAGGKLTGYRKMAERVVNKIADKIQRDKNLKIPKCTTDEIKLSGGKIYDAPNFYEFEKNKINDGIKLGLTEEIATETVKKYGSNAGVLFEIMAQLIKSESSDLPLILRAQLIYAIEYEMCFTPADFFIRRTGLMYFDIDAVIKWKSDLILCMKNILSFKDDIAANYSKELENVIKNCKGV